MQFATIDELADWLGDDTVNDQTLRAQLLLETASEQVDAWCNRVSFERAADDETELQGTWSNRLELPGQPVVSVATVTIDGTAVTDWDLVRGTLWRGTHGWDPNTHTHQGNWAGPDSLVTVTYTHGFATVPGDVKAVVLEAAGRAWNARSGVVQKSVGDASVSYASETSGVSLFQHERDRLSKYRRTAGALTL